METIKGYLQEMPDLRYTYTGKAIIKMRIADEELEDDWDKRKTIVCWESLAERMHDILCPSVEAEVYPLLYFKGYWKTNEWTSNDGREMSSIEFNAKQVWWASGEATPVEI